MLLKNTIDFLCGTITFTKEGYPHIKMSKIFDKSKNSSKNGGVTYYDPKISTIYFHRACCVSLRKWHFKMADEILAANFIFNLYFCFKNFAL